jgi:integrase/recombinase XerD
MSLAPEVDQYISVRRSLGYDLSTAERILRRFVGFADSVGATHIDTNVFLSWDSSLPTVGSNTRAARLGVIRHFALWLSSIDQAHEAPPQSLLRGRKQRPCPYIFNKTEIADIVLSAKKLPSTY